MHHFVSSQDEYSLLVRKLEHEMLPAIAKHGISELPYFPLASGLLTGKYRKGSAAAKGTRLGDQQMLADKYLKDENLQKVERLEAFAKQRGHTLLELAFSWLVSHHEVASVIAGATKPEQVATNAKAGDWELTKEEMAEVDQIASAVPVH